MFTNLRNQNIHLIHNSEFVICSFYHINDDFIELTFNIVYLCESAVENCYPILLVKMLLFN